MENLTIEYRFKFSDGSEDVFQLNIDAQSLELKGNIPDNPPPWTKLDFHQCPNCLLSPRMNPYCPLALNLVNIVTFFDRIYSYDELDVEVRTTERFISQRTSAQRAVSSLMGVVIATSGCPHTVFFKPMARFHLPFASEDETVYRAVSMYLLAQFFLTKDGKKGDSELLGLKKIYDNMQGVNSSIAERLRAGSKTDTSVNSIVLLNLHAMAMPYFIEESLDNLRYLFAPYVTIFDDPENF